MGFGVGETVGPYKISAFIAQGGMATIYKAHHITLDRDVALKVIHPALKQDTAYVARLKREAAIIARLIHPNIVTVFDFNEEDGLPYLVLQYIDGKTLKDVLRAQKLSTTQILNIIHPVADALTFAHEQNILHRDVKPSNILIDTKGHVYLADFGLARIEQSGESTASQDMLIGSPQYISPEQAKSQPVDARTDVYSLGVVLYEMLTGRVPFQGDSPYATILAQINDPPPAPRDINPRIRPSVEQVLLKALAKEPRERYRTIREMIKGFDNAVKGPSADEVPAPIQLADYVPPKSNGILKRPILPKLAKPQTQNQNAKRLPVFPISLLAGALIVLLLCLVSTGIFAWQWSSNTTTPTRIAAMTTTNIPGYISPTALRIANATATATRAPNTPTATTALPPATREATAQPVSTLPTVTRDAGVQPVSVPRGKIAYSVAMGEAAELHFIWVANADGSNPQKIIDLSLWPSISPDGKQIAYYRMKDEGIYISNIDGGSGRRVVTGETCCVQWSRDGKRLVYFLGKPKFGGSIYLVNVDGTNNTKLVDGFNPALSPDGTKLAYASCETNGTACGLFIYDMTTKASTMITRDGGGNPQWSPQGNRIVYQAGNPNVFVVNPDGSGIRQLTSGKSNDGQPVWSSDGNFIFWRSDQDGKAWGIFVMRADGSEKRLLINNVPPDGERWGRESLSAGP